MQLAAVDHCAPRRVVGRLLQGKRRAQHVAREPFPALGIAGGNAHLVVDGEAAVAPAEHLPGERRRDDLSSDEEADDRPAQPLSKERFRDRRQGSEASRSFKDAVGDERVHVGVEVDQVAEGLHEEDEARAGARMRDAVRPRERARDDAAELSEKGSAVGKEWADEPWNGEDVLPVRDGTQHALLDPLAVGEDALLMTARAEVARLAREGEQQVVTAPAAADACEAAVQVAAFQKALVHILLDGAAHAPRRAQLREVAADALP